ncbi:MAG: MATE family efflux transporter, partial [Bacillota bacterium]|nr:MATE family efflux transporter [Bacillota bacterium]
MLDDSKGIFEGVLTGRKFTNFIWPSILMMFVLALYYTIDSIFVANLIGEDGLAALNIAYPLQGIMWGLSIMMAAGSSALVSIEMGRKNQKKADEQFTWSCTFAIGLGVVFSLIGMLFLPLIVNFLGATELLTEYCHEFLGIFLWGCPMAFLGALYEFFIRADGSPIFTIALYVAGGVAHLVLDIVFMGPLQMGMTGAALANISGLTATALMGFIYFLRKNTNLNYRKFVPDFKFIIHSFLNGTPEFFNEASGGIITFFFNLVFIRLAGETGVAAAAIVLQIHYLFMSIHIGYQAGTMPLISYYYGAREFEKINKVLKYTKRYILVTSFGMAGLCALAAPAISRIYVYSGTELFHMSVFGLRLISLSVLVVGVNIFVSGFFTCYGQGVLSSLVSLSRGIVMLILGLYLLSY